MVKIVRRGVCGRRSLLTEDQKVFLGGDMTFMDICELAVAFKARFKTFSDGSLIAAKNEFYLREILKRYLKKTKRI